MIMDDRTFDKRTMLKVKIKSLAVESRIIRKEERKSHNGHIREQLYLHRIHDVRREARVALLAYGFLRGRLLHDIQATGIDQWDVKRVAALVEKYGIYLSYHDNVNWSEYRRGIEKAKEAQSAAFDTWVSAKRL